MDNHSKEVRSYNMSKIRSTGTKPEEFVRKYPFSKGLRYRKNVKTLPGKPDIVFSKYKTVVFVNGCFWHGHDCRNTRPSDNAEYWQKKRERNIKHDKEVTAMFENRGWTVIRIWECELKNKNRSALINKLSILKNKELNN
mgnify:CR=1 FL=1